ncbi:MAG: sn-glycerol-1-phosphate dehydrogenase [Clostridia bacterium]|nr:sn-glycerol-1-phosphate dehydrogenase [Clostridia bacterium]
MGGGSLITKARALAVGDGIPDIDGLLGEGLDCACGKRHACGIDQVLIYSDALNELPALTADFHRITLVCDKNTYRVCGRRVKELLADKVKECLIYEDGANGFVVPNEDAVARLEGCVYEKTDLIIGVGSGVINDLCKYVSFAHGLPYFIVATAPSMDGYASKGAAMIFNGMKVTTNADVPRVIIADTAVLKEAPLSMLKAGYGDMIGKYSCLNDWRLGALVNGEYFCEFVYELTFKTVEVISKMGRAILSRDEASIATLMRGLVIVGIAMAYVGNSRPASGSEHHLSHYFEIVGLLRDEPYFCHGIDVAYSTYETARLRRALLYIKSPEGKPFDIAEWEAAIYRVYGTEKNTDTAQQIIKLQKKIGWIYEDRLSLYKEKWEEIREILASSPTPERVGEMLGSVDLPLDDFERMYTREKRSDAIRYAKDLKDRYSVLWLYEQVLREKQ